MIASYFADGFEVSILRWYAAHISHNWFDYDRRYVCVFREHFFQCGNTIERQCD